MSGRLGPTVGSDRLDMHQYDLLATEAGRSHWPSMGLQRMAMPWPGQLEAQRWMSR
jgi:hypothetical protein